MGSFCILRPMAHSGTFRHIFGRSLRITQSPELLRSSLRHAPGRSARRYFCLRKMGSFCALAKNVNVGQLG